MEQGIPLPHTITAQIRIVMHEQAYKRIVAAFLDDIAQHRVQFSLSADGKRLDGVTYGYLDSAGKRTQRRFLVDVLLRIFHRCDDDDTLPLLIGYTKREQTFLSEQARLRREHEERLRRARRATCSISVRAYNWTQHARVAPEELQRVNQLRDQQRVLRVKSDRTRAASRQRSNAQARQVSGQTMRGMKHR